MNANDANPKAPSSWLAFIIALVTVVVTVVGALVGIQIASVNPLHGRLDTLDANMQAGDAATLEAIADLRNDMREDRAAARADAIRIEERLNAILEQDLRQSRLTAPSVAARDHFIPEHYVPSSSLWLVTLPPAAAGADGAARVAS